MPEEINLFQVLYAIILIASIGTYRIIFEKYKFGMIKKILFWVVIIGIAATLQMYKLKIPLKPLTNTIATNFSILSAKSINNSLHETFKFEKLITKKEINGEYFIKSLLHKNNEKFYLYLNPKCEYLQGCYINSTSEVLVTSKNLDIKKEIFTKRICDEQFNKDGIKNFIETIFNQAVTKIVIPKNGKAKILSITDGKDISKIDFEGFSMKKHLPKSSKLLNSCKGVYSYTFKSIDDKVAKNALNLIFDKVQTHGNTTIVTNKMNLGIYENDNAIFFPGHYLSLDKYSKLKKLVENAKKIQK